MIERTHSEDGCVSSAVYSPCETYRYALTRVWDEAKPKLCFVMLNPSKATEAQNDPTIERCQRRAVALGYGAVRAVNIFALRQTDPHVMRKHADAEGPDNAQAILDAVCWADVTIAAWGTHGAHLGQGPKVATLLRGKGHVMHHLGLTKDGHPRHPLYVAYSEVPQLWDQTDDPRL